MAEATGIKEPQWSERRIIALNQEFHPFDSIESKVKKLGVGDLGLSAFGSHVILDIEDDNLKVPINMSVAASRAIKRNSITPFNRELGYQIDSEDLKLESRIKKSHRLERERVKRKYRFF